MKRIVLIAFCAMLCFAANAKEYNAALVADMDTGAVLFKDRADDLNYPASLTKIMTMYLTFDALEHDRLHLSDQLIVSQAAAAAKPVKLGLAAGSKISVEDAIKALAVLSANDVARVLAENLKGGKEGNFASLMTDVARQIGLSKTNFENASGLPDDDHLSSARDIALLSMATYKHFPQYWKYFGIKNWTYGGKTYTNGNRLLGSYPGADGMKTGYTNSAKYCLVATAKRGDRRMMAVVLGAPNKDVRTSVARKLLDKGFGGESLEFRVESSDMEIESENKVVNKPSANSQLSTLNSKLSGGSAAGKTGVQFGAFGSRQAAESQVKKVQGAFNIKPAIEPAPNGMFRVRANGLSESYARQIASQCGPKGVDCYVFH